MILERGTQVVPSVHMPISYLKGQVGDSSYGIIIGRSISSYSVRWENGIENTYEHKCIEKDTNDSNVIGYISDKNYYGDRIVKGDILKVVDNNTLKSFNGYLLPLESLSLKKKIGKVETNEKVVLVKTDNSKDIGKTRSIYILDNEFSLDKDIELIEEETKERIKVNIIRDKIIVKKATALEIKKYTVLNMFLDIDESLKIKIKNNNILLDDKIINDDVMQMYGLIGNLSSSERKQLIIFKNKNKNYKTKTETWISLRKLL